MDDHNFMQMALDLAIKGEGFTSPNPMVGAVVVKDGKVVGDGYHEVVGGPHAEVNAIDAAGKLATGRPSLLPLSPVTIPDVLIPAPKRYWMPASAGL